MRELREALRIERKTIAAQEGRIADLLARNAILAAALEPFATLWASSIDEFPGEQSIHGIASVRMIKRARAALTADDRKAGEYLRALEAEHEAAVAANQAHEVFLSSMPDWAIQMDAAHRLRDEKEDIWRAAVRAVQEKQDAAE